MNDIQKDTRRTQDTSFRVIELVCDALISECPSNASSVSGRVIYKRMVTKETSH